MVTGQVSVTHLLCALRFQQAVTPEPGHTGRLILISPACPPPQEEIKFQADINSVQVINMESPDPHTAPITTNMPDHRTRPMSHNGRKRTVQVHLS